MLFIPSKISNILSSKKKSKISKRIILDKLLFFIFIISSKLSISLAYCSFIYLKVPPINSSSLLLSFLSFFIQKFIILFLSLIIILLNSLLNKDIKGMMKVLIISFNFLSIFSLFSCILKSDCFIIFFCFFIYFLKDLKII